jgi:ABC-type sugar transport system permease subunit/ABC-type glycerol-3-phosphate transport system substrate-binding protein
MPASKPSTGEPKEDVKLNHMFRLGIIVLLFIAVAFPSLAQPGGSDDAKPTDQIEVTIFEGGEGLEFYAQTASEFEEKTGVEVLLQGDPAMADRMRMRVLESNYPEVTNANVDVWNLIEHDQVLPLDQWLDKPTEDGRTWRETFLPGSLSQYQKDGKTYGVPLVYVVWSVYYNKRMFRQNGWERPETWDQFLKLCEKIKASGTTPIAFQGRYSFYARPLVEHTYFHLAGVEAYLGLQSAEQGAFSDPAMVESLGLLNELARNYFPQGFQGMNHTEAQLEFFQGRSAMLFCGSWLYSEMQDNIPEDFELGAFSLPLPSSPNAAPGFQYASSGFFFVFKNSAHPELGVRFLQQMTSPENAGRFAGVRGIPVAISGGNQKLHAGMRDVALQLEDLQDTFGPMAGPSISGLSQVWTDNLDAILQGSVTPQEAASQMERQAQAARNAAANPNRIQVRHRFKTAFFLLFLLSGVAVGIGGGGRSATRNLVRVSGLQAQTFLLPAALVFSLFFALPSLVALGGSLIRWDGLGQMEWVGLLHLKRLLLESDLFWLSLGHNLILMIVPALFVIPLSLLLAALLQSGVIGARVFRIAFFFPNLIGVAGILLWQQLYNPQIGPINKILTSLGLDFEGFAWLSSQNLYYALVPMAIWAAAGFNMVLFLAAMQSVPQNLYEAADVHGATGVQKFRFITLPLIRDTVAVSAVLMVIGGMKAFEAIWLLTNQAPTSETHVVGTLMVRSLFVEQRIGQAAALACLLFAIVLVGSLYASLISGRDS